MVEAGQYLQGIIALRAQAVVLVGMQHFPVFRKVALTEVLGLMAGLDQRVAIQTTHLLEV